METIKETRPFINSQHKKGSGEDDLKIPSLKSGKISLSDIIAATIGEDARSGDFDDEVLCGYNSDMDKTGEHCDTRIIGQDLNFSFYLNENQDENLSVHKDDGILGGLSYSDTKKLQIIVDKDQSQQVSGEDLNFSFYFKENQDENFKAQRDDGTFNSLQYSDAKEIQNIVKQHQSQPESGDDLNFSFYFKETQRGNSTGHPNDLIADTQCLEDPNERQNFECEYQRQQNVKQNYGDSKSFLNNSISELDFKNDFPVNLSFGSVHENHDDFLKSLFEADSDKNTSQTGDNTQEVNKSMSKSSPPTNPLNDSDLEDSMHFVDPDDVVKDIKAESEHDIPEPKTKKRRLSHVLPISSTNHSDFRAPTDSSFLPFTESFKHYTKQKQSNSTFHRRRSFSGTSGHLPQLGVSRHENLSQGGKHYKTPTLFRTRSFSEAYHHEMLSPITEGRPLDTSLSSLLGSPNENIPLSNNPFYEDLKCTLLSDLSNSATDDCPKALFDTLCQRQNSDVYARERNLQSRFSSLQSKYPDEVRDLSSFYRQQSAEVETERFREIHDEKFPTSYRNHLNQHYDNLLHMIMERVERSLQLLSKAKQESVSVIQGFRPRPLLSRKAVSMMEEWYTRNYEHPYPSHTAVEALAAAGEITTEQVKKWFANKRNRNKNTRPMNEVVSIKRKRQFSSRW